MSIKALRPGPVASISDASRAIEDIQQTVNQLVQQALVTTDKADGSNRLIPVMQTDGTVQLWKLVSGSGTTLSYNSGTKTITVTSP